MTCPILRDGEGGSAERRNWVGARWLEQGGVIECWESVERLFDATRRIDINSACAQAAREALKEHRVIVHEQDTHCSPQSARPAHSTFATFSGVRNK
jgi:hypothetical protein